MTKPNSSSMTKKRPLIRASELAHYSFCERAWWLATVKKAPAANRAGRRRGARYHQAHGRQVQAARLWQQAGLVLLGGGALLLVMAIWLGL